MSIQGQAGRPDRHSSPEQHPVLELVEEVAAVGEGVEGELRGQRHQDADDQGSERDQRHRAAALDAIHTD